MAAFRLLIFVLIIISSCRQSDQRGSLDALEEVPLRFAEGFSLFRGENYYIIEIIHQETENQRFWCRMSKEASNCLNSLSMEKL